MDSGPGLRQSWMINPSSQHFADHKNDIINQDGQWGDQQLSNMKNAPLKINSQKKVEAGRTNMCFWPANIPISPTSLTNNGNVCNSFRVPNDIPWNDVFGSSYNVQRWNMGSPTWSTLVLTEGHSPVAKKAYSRWFSVARSSSWYMNFWIACFKSSVRRFMPPG